MQTTYALDTDAEPKIEAWRVQIEFQGGREVVDLRLYTRDLDNVWRPSSYGVSIAVDELLAELESALGPRLYAGDPAANFLNACARAERAARHLRRRRKRVTAKNILRSSSDEGRRRESRAPPAKHEQPRSA